MVKGFFKWVGPKERLRFSKAMDVACFNFYERASGNNIGL